MPKYTCKQCAYSTVAVQASLATHLNDAHAGVVQVQYGDQDVVGLLSRVQCGDLPMPSHAVGTTSYNKPNHCLEYEHLGTRIDTPEGESLGPGIPP